MKALLTPDARDRLATIGMVKPQKAAALKNYLVTNARRLRQVNDEKLIGLLASMDASASASVTIKRRTYSDDEDDDDDSDLL